MKEIEELSFMLHERIDSKQKAFRKVTLIAVDTDLNRQTRSKKIDTSESREAMLNHAEDLLKTFLEQEETTFRRVGLRVSDLVDRKAQMTLNGF